MKHKGESFGIRFALICAPFVFSLIACSFFESVFGPSEPVVGTVNPTFAATMKDMDATSDALGALVRFDVKKVIVSGDQLTLSISIQSKASQAEFEIDMPLPTSEPVSLTDQNGSVFTHVPIVRGQQIITVSLQRPTEPPPWHAWLVIGHVNGTSNKFGYPLALKP